MGIATENPTPDLLSAFLESGSKEPMLLYRDGEPVAASISMEDFELLRKAEIEGLLGASDRIAERVQQIGIDDQTLAELLGGRSIVHALSSTPAS